MKSQLQLLMGLMDDIHRLHSGVKGLERDKITLKSRYEHEGFSFFTIALSSFCDSLDRGLADGCLTCPMGFSKVPRGALPRFLSGLLCQVFDSASGYLKEDPAIDAILSIRQLCRFFKKVVPTNQQENSLDKSARNTFRETDVNCGIDGLSQSRQRLLSTCSGYVNNSSCLRTFEDSSPRHGPGGVYERALPNQKWSEVVEAFDSERFDVRTYGLDSFRDAKNISENESNCHVVLLQAGSNELRSIDVRFSSIEHDELRRSRARAAYRGRLLRTCYSPLAGRYQRDCLARHLGVSNSRGNAATDARFVSSDLSKRISRLISVPKSSTSRRTITIEPCWLQFLQQALNSKLRKSIESDRLLRLSLDLTDQSLSQQLALEGSRTQAWVTIDLKSASDLLSNELVELCFSRSSPELLELLMETRSLLIKDGDNLYPLKKYAGMGNATTFPVQSICYTLIVVAAIHEQWGVRPTRKSMRRAFECVRVFGDDIIVRSEYSRHVCDWIEAAGLKVNQKKSFLSGYFREACGVDAYKGTDVTPVYVRVDPVSSTCDPSHLASLVASSNSLFMRGYYKASNLLKEVVEKRLGRLPLVRSNSAVLGWHTRLEACSISRWNKDLHRFEVRGLKVVSRRTRDPLDGWSALLKFFLTPLIQRHKDHLSFVTRKFDIKLAKCWESVYC